VDDPAVDDATVPLEPVVAEVFAIADVDADDREVATDAPPDGPAGSSPPQPTRPTTERTAEQTATRTTPVERPAMLHRGMPEDRRTAIPDCPGGSQTLGSASVTSTGPAAPSAAVVAAVTVVVGVDGSGRTHRLERLASGLGGDVVRLAWTAGPGPSLDAVLDAALAGATLVVDDAHRLRPEALVAVLDAVHR
jgi:hypothetical protein